MGETDAANFAVEFGRGPTWIPGPVLTFHSSISATANEYIWPLSSKDIREPSAPGSSQARAVCWQYESASWSSHVENLIDLSLIQGIHFPKEVKGALEGLDWVNSTCEDGSGD